jgi:putative FmdB family regulatory protein
MPPLFYEERTMPIHEFMCLSCNSNFELLLMSKAEIAEVRCPMCQSPEVQRLLSAANVSVTDGNRSRPAKSTAPSEALSGRNVQERTCGSGSCSTFELSGHDKEK